MRFIAVPQNTQPQLQLPPALGQLLSAVAEWLDCHRDEIVAFAKWFEFHEPEIKSFAIWAAVQSACKKTRLYAPIAPVWQDIAEAEQIGKSTSELAALILSAYAPGGAGHGVLLGEIRSAALLQSRTSQVGEVLDSWVEGRNYVAICGALPLAEGLLAEAHGKWQSDMGQYRKAINRRLDESGSLPPDEEADLILNSSALEMVLAAPETIWKSGHTRAGASSPVLNRHKALHGTSSGWDSAENATYSTLLLSAAARIAGPLLGRR